MKRRRLNAVLLLALSLASCAPVTGNFVWVDAYPQPAASPELLIKPGDLVEVHVFNQEQLSGKARVRSDGKITLPTLNDVEAGGQTPSALVEQLRNRMKSFINAPLVTVSVEEAKPAPVSVIGRVSRPGQYSAENATTVLQALAVAGGLTDFARHDRIYVLRAGPPQERIRFRYESLLIPESRAAVFQLRGGDVIAVE